MATQSSNETIINTSTSITINKEHMPKELINFVIYHSPCSDGTGSMWAAWRFLSKEYPDRQVTYYKGVYDKPPPDLSELAGKNILICDFSYNEKILNSIIKVANNLLILDHHVTARENLKNIPDRYKVFDMNHSGAFLTWKYFFSQEPVPLMIDYIQDRDLWTNKLEYINEYAAWFFDLPHEAQVYEQYFDNDIFLNMLKTKGKYMVEKTQHLVNQASNYASVKFQKINETYLFIAYLNTTVFKSELGNKIILDNKYADFAAVYSINDFYDSTLMSLRSTSRHYDTTKVSSFLGAGGHSNASAVKLLYVTNTLPGVTLDNGKLYKDLDKIYFKDITLDTKILNIVYLNSNSCRHELGVYLLQEKYVDLNTSTSISTSIQECIAIYRERENLRDFYMKVHMSVISTYDGNKDETVYKVTFDKEFKKENESVVEQLRVMFNIDESGYATYIGFQKELVKKRNLKELLLVVD